MSFGKDVMANTKKVEKGAQPSRQFGTGVRVFAVSLGVLKTILMFDEPNSANLK